MEIKGQLKYCPTEQKLIYVSISFKRNRIKDDFRPSLQLNAHADVFVL